MKLLTATVTNFGSYSHLEFDFSDIGLGLVYGATGSGKSTLADIAPWCLFGITAKDGNVDDICSWQANGAPTQGQLYLETHTGIIAVTRIRGKASQNDLYWTEGNDGEAIRGKDMADTQRLLEKRLGVTADLYLTGAYFQEFSQTGAFFTAKAKDRRAVFEKIADLALPTALADCTANARKETKKAISEAATEVSKLEGEGAQLKDSIAYTRIRLAQWDRVQQRELEDLRSKADTYTASQGKKRKDFEEQKQALISKLTAEIEAATDNHLAHNFLARLDFETQRAALGKELQAAKNTRCDACGAPVSHEATEKLTAALYELKQQENQYIASFTKLENLLAARNAELTRANPFDDNSAEAAFVEALRERESQVNPFCEQLEQQEQEFDVITKDYQVLKQELANHERLHRSYDFLNNLASDLRGALLTKAVSEIEAATNRHLEQFFDAEIRVTFRLDGDSLEVDLQKSGYPCVFRQLSKGQRQMLKLSFAVSVMEAASNKAGVHFETLFLDEALDGLDTTLKLKAFGLFEQLAAEHSTVLVIDHSEELRERFDTRYAVTLEADQSQVEREDGT